MDDDDMYYERPSFGAQIEGFRIEYKGGSIISPRWIQEIREEMSSSYNQNTYYAKLFRVAYSMLHDEDESHDAVHVVFATIWAKKVMVNPDTEKEYLVRCVRNYCINQIASKEREEMPEKTREVLRLCFGQEKSYAEAASTLQLSVAYVNKHIVKALRLLRERFNPNTKKTD